MRTHRAFLWVRHDASEIKKSIFDVTLCFRTIGKYNFMLIYSFLYHVIIHFIVNSQLLFLRIRGDT